jgi:peptide/nickel transport system substrate-binding protein
MYKKTLLIVLSLTLLLSGIPIASVSAQVPRANEIAVGTIGEPETVDPQWLYDTASAEIVMNVYDTLIAFLVDRSEPDVKDWGKTANFSASLAYQWYLDNETDPDHPVYYFKIRGSHNHFVTLNSLTTVNPYSPVSTQWECVEPLEEYGEEWHLWIWEDNGDEILSPGDQVKMQKKTYYGPDEMPFIAFHVESVIDLGGDMYTIVLKEKPIPFQSYRMIEILPGFEYEPVCNQVFEMDPIGGREYHVEEWEDFDLNGIVSPGDILYMHRKDPAPVEYPDAWYRDYIVEEIVPGAMMIVKPCLTCWDVEYSFERWFVLDHGGGPQWMIYEPLTYPDYEWPDANEDDIPDPEFAPIVDAAIETNCTWVWFTFAGSYPTMIFLQVVAQSWASILYMDWAMDQGCWDGDWATVATYHDPLVSPLMDPQPVMCGTGPYYFVDWTTGKHWVIERFDEHWQQWPAPGCDGYVDIVRVEFIPEWPTRKLMFLAGDLDFCYVPRMYMYDVLGKPGVRCIYPLATLSTDGNFFNFDIATTSRYLKPPFTETLAASTFKNTGIPPDFFTDINLRKAFCYCVNYTEFIEIAYLGEAAYPATPAIFNLPYRLSEAWYAEHQYYLNLTEAEYYFKLAWGGTGENPGHDPDMVTPGQVWTTGFKLPLCYNVGNLPRKTMAEIIETNAESLNTEFTVDVYEVEWGTVYIPELFHGELTMFIIGWLADYPDPHNFFFPFMHTYGAFSDWQSYSNPVADALIEEGGTCPDEIRRAEIYAELQQMYIDEAPSVCTDQPTGRHWEKTWIHGWYYNSIYPGGYFKHYWKDVPPGVETMKAVDMSVAGSIGNVTQWLVNYHTGNTESGLDDGQPIVKIMASDCPCPGSNPTIPVAVDWSREDSNTEVVPPFYAIVGITMTKGSESHTIDPIMFTVGGIGSSGIVLVPWSVDDPDAYCGNWTISEARIGVVSGELYDDNGANDITTTGESWAIIYGTGDTALAPPIITGFVEGDTLVGVSDLVRIVFSIPSMPGDANWNWYTDYMRATCEEEKVSVADLVTIVSLVPTDYLNPGPEGYGADC